MCEAANLQVTDELVSGAARALGAELPPRVAMLIDPVGPEDSYRQLLAQGMDRAISELGLDPERIEAAPGLMDQALRRLSEDDVT